MISKETLLKAELIVRRDPQAMNVPQSQQPGHMFQTGLRIQTHPPNFGVSCSHRGHHHVGI